MIWQVFRRAGGQPSAAGWMWPGKLFLLFLFASAVMAWPRVLIIGAATGLFFVVPVALAIGGGSARRTRQAADDELRRLMDGMGGRR